MDSGLSPWIKAILLRRSNSTAKVWLFGENWETRLQRHYHYITLVGSRSQWEIMIRLARFTKRRSRCGSSLETLEQLVIPFGVLDVLFLRLVTWQKLKGCSTRVELCFSTLET